MLNTIMNWLWLDNQENPKKEDVYKVEEPREFQVKKWDPSKMRDNATILILGKRASGKTTLIKDILWHKRHINRGIIIDPTIEYNSAYEDIFPREALFDTYIKEIPQNLIDYQNRIIKKEWETIKSMYPPNSSVYLTKKGEKNFYAVESRDGTEEIVESPIDTKSFIVFDDCLNDIKYMKDEHIRNLFLNGRTYNVMNVFSLDYTFTIPPELRTNADYVFILNDNSISRKKCIYAQYAAMFHSFEDFNAIFEECTKDYSCMVIDYTSKIENQVFWYKAELDNCFEDSEWEVIDI